MKPEKWMDALGEIDDRYIQEASSCVTGKKAHVWKELGAIAVACLLLVLIAGGYVVYRNAMPSSENMPELPLLSASLDAGAGMGFEGLMFYDISESDNGNPWKEEQTLKTLPVYQNLAYTDEAGTPVYLSKEELLSIAEKTAVLLGEEIGKPEYSTIECTWIPDFSGKETYEMTASSDSFTIRVEGNGCVSVKLLQPIELQGRNGIGSGEMTDEEAIVVTEELSKKYASLLGFDKPVTSIWGDYTYFGEWNPRYCVYNDTDDIVQCILNYNFSEVRFGISQGQLRYINIDDKLTAAEKLGDYPLITSKEARKLLLQGDYLTTVPEEYLSGGEIRKSDIAKTELVYLTGNGYEVFMPFYRFYVRLSENSDFEMAEGLKFYGIYYVPAVQSKYLLDFPAEIRFN